MPLFNYTAIDPKGRPISDSISADSVAALESALQSQGAWLLKARTVKKGSTRSAKAKSRADGRIKRWDLINFYTQLSLLLNAGVTLAQALAKLAEDLRDSKLGPIVSALAASVEAGTPLPKALGLFPKAFSSQTIALVEAGEVSGQLAECFSQLASNLEWFDGLVATARQALIYPIMICCAAVGLIVLLFTFVVPRFESIFAQLDAELPQITLAVLGVSSFFASNWYVWILLAAGLLAFGCLSFKVERIAILKDRVLLKLPFLGELSQCLAISQFATTLEMLIKSGIPLARALELCSRQSDNSLVTVASRATQVAVNEGRPMSDELRQHPIFTQTFITMVQTGEKSGQLDTTLNKVSAYYDLIVPRKIKAFFAFFEPAIILTLIGVVATVALALVLPILSIWNT